MILLDMDGVIVDLVSGIKEIFGEPNYENTWNIHEWYNMDNDTFWSKTENEEFWANLKGFDGWNNFLNGLMLIDDVVLCSSPRSCPYSFSGKFKWIQKNLGKDFKDYIFIEQKHLLATIPNIILIDDYDGNVDSFRNNGGKAILIPRAYNENRLITNPYKYVIRELIKEKTK